MKAQLIPYYLLVQFLLWLLRFALFYILTDLKIYKDTKTPKHNKTHFIEVRFINYNQYLF